MKILAIVPARGGSKSIPDKNIVDLCGKPLITYTFDAAKGIPNSSATLGQLRLTTLRNCDMIVELAGGKIKATGTYEEIVSTRNGSSQPAASKTPTIC